MTIEQDHLEVRRGYSSEAIKRDFLDHLNFSLAKDQYTIKVVSYENLRKLYININDDVFLFCFPKVHAANEEGKTDLLQNGFAWKKLI